MTDSVSDRIISHVPDLAVAVVGAACRLPGASSIAEFWNLLIEGRTAVRRFDDDELAAAGVPVEIRRHLDYVPASAVLDDPTVFDPEFFGMTHAEASLVDPQQRLLLEIAYRALEDAGLAGSDRPRRTGFFASTSPNTWLLNQVLAGSTHVHGQGRDLGLLFASEKDFAATRTAWRLGLEGPCVTVQTACSSGLVAVNEACRALLAGDCDVALAGAAAVRFPHEAGYLHQEGSIFSRQGVCRSFDAEADGCVPGNGVVVVVLRRLADAIAEGDTIDAVVLGSAVNNDGQRKAGFAAPSVAGQAEVIRAAQVAADVTPDQIAYIETHGTGTRLGDEIELRALNDVFAQAPPGSVQIGSLKSNIGHLDAAAGLAGFLKVVLMLRRRRIPPHPSFRSAPDHAGFDDGPLTVATGAQPWPGSRARIAGVSSFGVGGTNAHAILAEAPALPERPPMERACVLVLSERSPAALTALAARLADELERRPSARLEAIAATMWGGRPHLDERAAVIVEDVGGAVLALREIAASGGTHRIAGIGAEEAAVARWIAHDGVVARDAVVGLKAIGHLHLPGVSLIGRACRFEQTAPPRSLKAEGWSEELNPITNETSLEPWIYARQWTRRAMPPGWGPTKYLPPHGWCVVHRGGSEGQDLAAILAGHGDVIEIVCEVDDRAALAESCRRVAAVAGEQVIIVYLGGEIAQPTIATDALNLRHAAPFVLSLALAKALAEARPIKDVCIEVLSRGRHAVLGVEHVDPAQAGADGPWLVLPQERTRITVRRIDLPRLPEPGDLIAAAAELRCHRPPVVALRAGAVWHMSLDPVETPDEGNGPEPQPIHTAGSIVISGAFGGIGAMLAREIAGRPGAKVALLQHRAPSCPLSFRATFAETVGSNLARTTFAVPVRLVDDDEVVAAHLRCLCTLGILRYWSTIGILPRIGAALQESDVLIAGRVVPALSRMVAFQIGLLERNGLLVRLSDGTLIWSDELRGSDEEIARIAAEITSLDPGLAVVVDLLLRAIECYPDALSGRIPSISVLYPEGSNRLMKPAAQMMLARSYGSAACRMTGDWVASAASAASAAEGRPLRVLEVGAGNGLLTSALFEAARIAGLDTSRIEFTITDLGRNFVEMARATAAGTPFADARFAVFDISADAAAQGFEPHVWDVICGLNVVHATPNVRRTLANLKSLLVPDGALLVVESVREEPWVDMVAGLAEGWWSFDDDRTGSPLLSTERWRAILEEGGWSDVFSYPDDPAAAQRADCTLLCARAPRDMRRAVDEDVVRLITDLEALGAEVTVAEAELTDAVSVTAAVADIRGRLGPIGAIVHCAGRISGATLPNLSGADVAIEFGARVDGAVNLLAATAADPVTHVVLTSSLNALFGGEGQAAYAAANAALAVLADHLRAEGIDACAIHWDRWRGVGLARAFEATHRRITGRNIDGGLSTAAAIEGFRRARRANVSELAITAEPIATRLSRYRAEATRPRPVEPIGPPTGPKVEVTPISEWHDLLLAFCRSKLSNPNLSLQDKLLDTGVDSLDVLELQDSVEGAIGLRISNAALMSETLANLFDACAEPAARTELVQVVDASKTARAPSILRSIL